jgi:deoxyribodipyrimidine photolyase-like uncharacterized protein
LYWHYLDRNRELLKKNHRMFQQLNAAKKLADIEATIAHGDEIIDGLERGTV